MRASGGVLSMLFLIASLGRSEALPLLRVAGERSPAPAIENNTADYIRSCAIDSLSISASAKIALKRAHDRAVRQFAQSMLNDPDASKRSFAALLDSDAFSMTLPQSIDREHAAVITQLGSAPDGDFDANYMQQQMLLNETALRLNATYAKTGRDDPLRRYAMAALPSIRQRLVLAERLFHKLHPRLASAR